MRQATWVSMTAAMVLAASMGGCGSPAAKGLGVVQTISLAGEGGWDYIKIDSAAGRAYVARSNRVMVVDLGDGALLGEVADVSAAHGVALIPALNLGFATAGREGTVNVFDLSSFTTLRKIKAGAMPDAILYDPASRKVFAFNHRSGDVTIIDPANMDAAPVLLPVGGILEFAATDNAGHVFVNVEDKSELAVIDSKQGKVIARWPLQPGAEPTGLDIDIAKGRLFVGCSNNKMIIMDANSGKVLGDVPVGAGVDGVAFDANLGLALSANGRDGTATVVGEVSPGRFGVVQTVTTAKSARTVGVDPIKHRFYLPFSQPAKDGKAGFGLLVVAGAK